MLRISYLFVLLTCITISPIYPQDECPLPSHLLSTNVPGLMNEKQENYFGDVFAEQLQYQFLVIEDDITDNIRRIGQRLLDQAPSSELKFQFFLVEYPQLNAFSLPGGKVYVTRKLVAACQSEDELVGVLAHEIGHLIARHPAISLTRLVRKVLNSDPAVDRKDVFDQYNQLLDNMARNPKALKAVSHAEEEEQVSADRISVYLTKKAGYLPEAYIQLWDRVQEVEGKTGGFWSDFFGTTKPEQKRLREMQRVAEQLPAACEGKKPSTTREQFEDWKTAVMAYSGIGHRESLPEAERKQPLHPRLRGNVTNMRFSGNGKYLLAQDSSSIFVLSHEPFKVLFRIDAQNANPAQFTPDSESIVFSTNSLRVEKWNIAEQQRTSVQEIAIMHDCLVAKISPDAKHLACLEADARLILFNVLDGTKILQKDFSNWVLSQLLGQLDSLLSSSFCRIEFSPDGRYFIGAGFAGDKHVAYDFVENNTVKLPDSIKDRLGQSFGFMSDNRFVGIKGVHEENAAIINFPSGEVLYKVQVGYSSISPVTHGDLLIVKPIQKYPAGIMDLTQNEIVMGIDQEAIDVYDKAFASEREDGVLSLYQINGKEAPTDEKEALGKAELPESPLPQPTAAALSADQNWLAISEKSRGAIWNLDTGLRTFLSRSFQEAYFAPDNTLVVVFPKSGETERMIVRINPKGPSVVSNALLADDRNINLAGLYLVEWKASKDKKNQDKSLLSVVNSLNGKEIWNRDYSKGTPWTRFSREEDRAIFIWGASSDFVKEESKEDPELKEKIRSKKEREGDYYVQILQTSTGNVLHKVYIETGRGSFRLRQAAISDNHLVLFDNQNRLLIYSISSGERIGQIFGVNGSLSPTKPLLAAENKPGVLTIYSLPSMAEFRKLKFARPLVFVKFSKDGNRLFVLTNDQTTYLFNTEHILTDQGSKEDKLR
jgi:WD40 repeat protein